MLFRSWTYEFRERLTLDWIDAPELVFGGEQTLLDQQASNDPNAAIRRSAVFALSRLPANEGVPRLVQLASTTKDPATRREAIFWLGQSRDPQALAYLEKLVTQ